MGQTGQNAKFVLNNGGQMGQTGQNAKFVLNNGGPNAKFVFSCFPPIILRVLNRDYIMYRGH